MTIGKEPCNCGPCAAARDDDRRRKEAKAERVDLALRLLALVERGWNIHERQGLEGMHSVDKWQARDGLSFVTAPTLEAAITAAEAEEAKRG